MQAIQTKYLGVTNFKGSRIKATAQAGSATVPWDHALSVWDNHMAAAKALATKLGWVGRWVGGGSADGHGCVYVCTFASGTTEGTFTIKGAK